MQHITYRDIDCDDWPFRWTDRFTKQAWFHRTLSTVYLQLVVPLVPRTLLWSRRGPLSWWWLQIDCSRGTTRLSAAVRNGSSSTVRIGALVVCPWGVDCTGRDLMPSLSLVLRYTRTCQARCWPSARPLPRPSRRSSEAKMELLLVRLPLVEVDVITKVKYKQLNTYIIKCVSKCEQMLKVKLQHGKLGINIVRTVYICTVHEGETV